MTYCIIKQFKYGMLAKSFKNDNFTYPLYNQN